MIARMRVWPLLLLLACEPEATASAQVAPPEPSAALVVQARAPVVAPVVAPSPACRAPSLAIRHAIDARDDAAARRCEEASVGPSALAARCGSIKGSAFSLHRLDEAVLPLDAATEANVRQIMARGRALGRRPDVFGVVGDSMTVSGAFLQALSQPERTVLSPEVEARVGTMLARYRGVEAQRVQGVPRDSFRAPRAAKVGARAPWALAGGAHSPLERMVGELSPSIALVLYGGNDAAYRIAPIAELERGFRADLERIVDLLEARGVVPVLHTLARHGDAPGVDDCGGRYDLSDWRIAVHTNALSAVVAAVACDRSLPLLDLRWALDAADLRGLSSDGIHPSSFAEGSGVLDERGLRCGYNVRNYVTLRMLGQLSSIVASP